MTLALALLSALPGCASVDYLYGSAAGHFDLLSRRRPIPEVIDDPATPQALRERLALVAGILAFAETELDLPAGGSYRSFVQLDRPYVTWTVVATPELSVQPRQWCYPVVGCVAYRGYFDERQARDFAASLDAQGLDTYVGGVAAYSTLGWFDDPVLSTMLDRGDTGLAAVLFHELAHQRLYVTDDTAFNESYAVAVERLAVTRWHESRGERAALESYRRAVRQRETFLALVAETRQRLAEVYASERPDADKRAAKKAIFEALRGSHARLRAQWGGRSPFDGWFEAPLNNARVALVSAYSELVGALLDMYREEQLDMAGFHARCGELAALEPAARRRALGVPGALARGGASRQPATLRR